MIGNGSVSTRKNAFCVTSNGWACAETGFVAGSADFAEWFPSTQTIPPFTPVYLDSGKVYPFNPDDMPQKKNIIGITSINPLLIGNNTSDHQKDLLGKDIYVKNGKCSSRQSTLQPSSSLFIVTSNGKKYISSQIQETQFYDHLNTSFVSTSITSIEPLTLPVTVYYFDQEDGSIDATIDTTEIQLLKSNGIPRSQDNYSLVGLAGQVLMDATYRPYVSNLPDSWIVMKENETFVTISSSGVIKQGITQSNGSICQVVIGKTNPQVEQTIYYDKILIK